MRFFVGLLCVAMTALGTRAMGQDGTPPAPNDTPIPPVVEESPVVEVTDAEPADAPIPNSAMVAESSAATSPDDASGQARPAATEFQQLFTEFKEILAQLRALQFEHREADETGRAEITAKWKGLIDKGDALKSRLLVAAEKAFLEAPNEDPQITALLVELLHEQLFSYRDRLQTDDYDEAFRLGKMLTDNGYDGKEIFEAFGVAAFAIDQYDVAEEYLKKADEEGVFFKEENRVFVDAVAKYKDYWAEERRIRQAEAEADDLPRVLLKTSKGDITIELFENEAPNTVANFISLVEEGFYNGLTFHRVLPGFMAQGGCPEGTGMGGPGYNIPCECYQPNYRKHFRGSLSMAKGAAKDTGGSQFFLTFLPTDHLNGIHTVFGRVITGMDVLPKLQRRNPEAPESPDPDIIEEAKVLRKRDHAYVPRKVGE